MLNKVNMGICGRLDGQNLNSCTQVTGLKEIVMLIQLDLLSNKEKNRLFLHML